MIEAAFVVVMMTLSYLAGIVTVIAPLRLFKDDEWNYLRESFRRLLWRMGYDWADKPESSQEDYMTVLAAGLPEQSPELEESESPSGMSDSAPDDLASQSEPSTSELLATSATASASSASN
jgi:hypothetical protein